MTSYMTANTGYTQVTKSVSMQGMSGLTSCAEPANKLTTTPEIYNNFHFPLKPVVLSKELGQVW